MCTGTGECFANFWITIDKVKEKSRFALKFNKFY